jgi:hypothetical protein
MGAEYGSVADSVVTRCDGVSRSARIDAIRLAGTAFSGLSALVIEDVMDGGDVIWVRARTRGGAVACPGCRTETLLRKVHRAAGMRTPPGPVAKHGQAVRPLTQPERLQRAVQYLPTLVDPYREHLSSTSPRVGPRPTSRTCHYGGRPGPCSPGPPALPPASARSSPTLPPPAPR